MRSHRWKLGFGIWSARFTSCAPALLEEGLYGFLYVDLQGCGKVDVAENSVAVLRIVCHCDETAEYAALAPGASFEPAGLRSSDET